MNENILFFIMDAVSFDQFERAETPFIEERAEKIQRAYTGSTWTLPSMKSFLHGIIPQTEQESLYQPMKQWWVPEPLKYRKAGYQTLAISGNPLFCPSSFPYNWSKFFPICDSDIKELGERMIGIFLREHEVPFYCVMLFIDTHYPYNGEKMEDKTLEEKKEAQRRGITYLDDQLKRLYIDCPSNTVIYVFADHGDVFREDKLGHNPKAKNIHQGNEKSCLMEPDLLEVPCARILKR